MAKVAFPRASLEVAGRAGPHARLVRFVRYRRLVPTETAQWSEPLESEGDLPMTMVRMEDRARQDLWPGDEHLGLPMLLPGGETGRLQAFEHAPDGSSWRYTLEFRGAREG